jgi:signal transduction histidine kinase
MKTILVVDDETQMRTILALALRRNGYHVIEADSGSSALLLARQFLPDLILSDIHMPSGDGPSLLRSIRSDDELRSKQVVLMTGRPDLVTPRRGMEEGADDFLVKPVSVGDLLKCIKARFSRASINWRVEDERLAEMRLKLPPQLPHEFFTPLAGIISLMELIRADDGGFSPKEIRDIHDDVYFSALRLHRTLRNYLLILELQSSLTVEEEKPLSSTEVEEKIRAGTREAMLLNKRDADLTIDIQASPIAIKPEDLVHIAEELVDNACKFSRQGTKIHVALDLEGKLTVTDQGRGMTVEQIEHIGAFQQFDRKKYEQQGLGLGLVLVQKLASRCRADFSITSTHGTGTQVQIIFHPPGSADRAKTASDSFYI